MSHSKNCGRYVSQSYQGVLFCGEQPLQRCMLLMNSRHTTVGGCRCQIGDTSSPVAQTNYRCAAGTTPPVMLTHGGDARDPSKALCPGARHRTATSRVQLPAPQLDYSKASFQQVQVHLARCPKPGQNIC